MTDSEIVDLEPLVKELYAALDGKVTEDILRKELEKYIVKYRTGVTIAKDSILKKYSGPRPSGTFVSGAGITKKINDLNGTEMSVNVVAKIIFIEKKEVSIKGASKTIISGILGDDTGTVPFTIWSDAGDFQKGSVYTFKNVYTKKWKDQVQVNVGTRGKVEPNSEVTFDTPTASSNAEDMKIGDITDQTRNLNVIGKISDLSSRDIIVKGETKTVFGGMLSDETGKIQFTDWADHGLQDGETISVKNAYIRSWKGIPQLNFGDRSEVTQSTKEIKVVSAGPTARTVEEVMKVGGGLDLVVTGMVVDVRTGSGLIKRCPKCKRSILGEECTVDGHVEPVMDLRLKLTVDDGTGAISAILNREDTEKVTGITLEQATEMAKEKGDMAVVANRMTSNLLLKKITVTGNIMSDDYGPQMSVHSASLTKTDITSEAEKLYDAVEGSI